MSNALVKAGDKSESPRMVPVRGLSANTIAVLNIRMNWATSVSAFIAESLQVGRLVHCQTIARSLTGQFTISMIISCYRKINSPRTGSMVEARGRKQLRNPDKSCGHPRPRRLSPLSEIAQKLAILRSCSWFGRNDSKPVGRMSRLRTH
jgi:hypothetical protein